jgi:hypothetical protein
MYHSLSRIGHPRNSSRTLVFVRGFQGLSKLKGVSDLSWYEDDPDGDDAITKHDQWATKVVWCLERARFTPELL